jgi:predicted  nucleic acid-binding Zn-ribbon protein
MADPITDPKAKLPEPIVPVQPVVPPAPPKKTVEQERYEASVKAMNASQREASELRKAVEGMKSQLQMLQASMPSGQEPNEEQKLALEKKYGINYGSLAALNDLLDVKVKKFNDLEGKINELGNSMAETRYEAFKGNLKASDRIFQKYEGEFEQELSQLPPSQRINKEKVDEVKSRIVAKHFNEIVEDVRAEERAKIVPAQPDAPEIGSVSGGGANGTPPPKSKLTPEQIQKAQAMNMDVQALEDYVSGKPSAKSSGWSSHRQ